jgi:hypothetical protein
MNEQQEKAYMEGQRAIWLKLLRTCLYELGMEEISKESLILEREEAISILRTVCSEFGDNDWPDNLHLADIIDKHFYWHLNNLEEENERLIEALHKIKSWTEAYPVEVFPEPDFELARKLLSSGGITLDAISASNMRHVLDGVKNIIGDVL